MSSSNSTPVPPRAPISQLEQVRPGGAHVLDADDQALLHGFKTGFEQQLLHERIADLHVGTLRARIFAESCRGHRRAVNAVAPGLRADVDDGIAETGGAAVEDLVLFENAEGECVDQRVLRVAAREDDFTADRRNAEAVSVESDAADDTFHDAPVLRAGAEARTAGCSSRRWVARPS